MCFIGVMVKTAKWRWGSGQGCIILAMFSHRLTLDILACHRRKNIGMLLKAVSHLGKPASSACM